MRTDLTLFVTVLIGLMQYYMVSGKNLKNQKMANQALTASDFVDSAWAMSMSRGRTQKFRKRQLQRKSILKFITRHRQ